MNPTVRHSAQLAFPAEQIHFDDFEISWAGSDPLTGNLWFGSYDGRCRTLDPEQGEFACPSGEAVNGIAFGDHALAVSTRSDVALITFDENGEGQMAVYEGGAHDVIATSAGGFIAPLGVHGVLAMKPTLGPKLPLTRAKVMDRRINFYKFARSSGENASDVIVGACRKDGLAIIELDHSEDRVIPSKARLVSSAGLDIIDVCPLASPETPRAAAWLDSDRTIHLSRDVLEDGPIKSLRLGTLFGRAYSLLHDRGHFFLLTSEGFFVLPDLASRYLSGDRDAGSTPILCHRGKSIDEIYLAGDSLLFAIDGDIHRTPVDLILAEVDRPGWPSSVEDVPGVSDVPWVMTSDREWSSESRPLSAA